MKMNRWMVGGAIAALLVWGNATALPVRATAEASRQIAQGTPGSVTGRFDERSGTLDDGRYITIHPYTGTVGEIVTFDVTSPEMDMAIVVTGPNGELVGYDNDSGDGTNARLTVELPATGVYDARIVSLVPGRGGQYTLHWRPASAEDLARYQANAPELDPTPEPLSGRSGSLAGRLGGSQGPNRDRPYAYEGTAGEAVTFELAGAGLDAILVVVGPDRKARTSHVGDRVSLSFELPETGTYRVSIASTAIGSDYTLRWRPATAADLAQRPKAIFTLPERLIGTSGSVAGRLEAEGLIVEGGRHIATHDYEGTAGETITFDLASADFEGRLEVLDPSGDRIARDDSGGIGTNARLTVVLPVAGSYSIRVVAAIPGEFGAYVLSWQVAEEGDRP